MRKLLFVGFLFFFSIFQIRAQQEIQRPVNTISINLFGNNGIGASFNYERLYFVNKNIFLSGGIGLGTGKELITDKSYISVPMHITGNYGTGRFFGELGLSGNYTSLPNQRFSIFPEAGLRLHPYKNGVFVKVYIIIYDLISIIPGLNFGYAF